MKKSIGESGVFLCEQALLLCVVAIVSVGAVCVLGDSLSDKMQLAKTSFDTRRISDSDDNGGKTLGGKTETIRPPVIMERGALRGI